MGIYKHKLNIMDKELIKEFIDKYEDELSQCQKLGRINPYSGYYAGQEDVYNEIIDDLERVYKLLCSTCS